jgi:hypothetical protein
MRNYITRALYAAAAAGIALSTLGVAGAAAPATAATRSLSPPVYDLVLAGYISSGRWFRFVATTVTVPPVTLPVGYGDSLLVELKNARLNGAPGATIMVDPGGGPGSVRWASGRTLQPFAMSPKIGDKLSVNIYYDRHSHIYFTATDLTQGVTRTAQASTGSVVYNQALLVGNLGADSPAPPANTRLWAVADTRLTTYTGTHGTVTGPWQTSPMILTSTATAAGRVVASPSGLWNGGANFGVWLDALPVGYTSGLAGYADSAGPFRFIATTMTVPSAQTPAANGGMAVVTLGHNGGPAPRPYATIEVLPGGGAGSVSYVSDSGKGAFTVTPKAGDQLAASVFYDVHGHYYSFTVTDTTQGTTQTVTVAAPYVSAMPLNSAVVSAAFDSSAVTSPPADIPLWQFTGSHVTTYGGYHGSITGMWATTRWIYTTDGTRAGAVVADASVLSNGGQDFTVWLRHQ